MKKNLGFTLIEIIIVILILSIIAAVSAELFTQGTLGYLTGNQITEANWQAQIALERMSRDIRAIRSPNDITTASASTLVFVDSSGNTQTYTTSGTTITLNGNVLSNGINSLAFSYYDKNGVTTAVLANIVYIVIVMNVTQNNTNFTFYTSLNARNLR